MFCVKQWIIYNQCWNPSLAIIGPSIYIIYVNNFISSHLKLLVEPFQHLHIVNKNFHQAPVNMLKRTVSQYSSRHRNLLQLSNTSFWIIQKAKKEFKNIPSLWSRLSQYTGDPQSDIRPRRAWAVSYKHGQQKHYEVLATLYRLFRNSSKGPPKGTYMKKFTRCQIRFRARLSSPRIDLIGVKYRMLDKIFRINIIISGHNRNIKCVRILLPI